MERSRFAGEVQLNFDDDLPGEALAIEAGLVSLMKRFIEIDPNAVMKIEKVFHKIKIERAVERSVERDFH